MGRESPATCRWRVEMRESQSRKQAFSVQRIRHLCITNFRGFVGGPHNLNVDADIILLSGPNGYGKTSLIEAMLLILTGHHYHYNREDLLSGLTLYSCLQNCGSDISSEQSKDMLRHRANKYSIVAQVAREGGEDIHLGVERRLKPERGQEGNEQFDAPMDQKVWKSWIANASIEDSELRARLCCFFQDRIDKLFDEMTHGSTLRDVVEPIPDQVRWYELLAKTIVEKLEHGRDDIASEKLRDVHKAIRNELSERFKLVREPYERLRKGREGGKRSPWPPWPDSIPYEETDEALTRFVEKVLSEEAHAQIGETGARGKRKRHNLPELFRQALESELKKQQEEARRGAGKDYKRIERIQGELDFLSGELNGIKLAFPDLDRDLSLFESDSSGFTSLLIIFRALSHFGEQWASLQGSLGLEASRLSRVIEELQAVMPTEAGKCAQALETWIEPRREAKEKANEIEEKMAGLHREIKRARASESLKELSDLEQRLDDCLPRFESGWRSERQRTEWEKRRVKREEARDLLNRCIVAVKWLDEALRELTGGSKELKGAITEMLNSVLGRFSLVEGILPLKLEPKTMEIKPESAASSDQTSRRARQFYKIVCDNGRTLDDLSTGQKSQIAISTLLAQNQAIPQYLSHEVLLIDDVTSSYDLSNLTREAIVWRQLAYSGTGDGSKNKHTRRRQIFISSHHEDLTNHLVDLLAPPKGREMRVVRFEGWSPESGPQYTLLRVSATESVEVDDKSRELSSEIRVALRRAIREMKW